MTTTSVATKPSTAAILATLRLSGLLIKLGSQLSDVAYSTPPRSRLLYAVGDWCAGVSLTLAERFSSVGFSLEAWAGRTGQRLGVLDEALAQVHAD